MKKLLAFAVHELIAWIFKIKCEVEYGNIDIFDDFSD